ncbi:MAG: o-succinylbenzoate--CoA ligase [Ignavibacteriaceae bacterium]|nr:o-succinylbenzoate--CoA ligase [Ignavibacteriaceae bacterium]
MELIGSLLKSKGDLNTHAVRQNKAAIITPDTVLTYKQLDERICTTLQSLQSLGIKSHDKVAILSENSLEYVVLVLSLWKLGAVPVPLNIRLLPSEIEDITLFAGCRFLLKEKSAGEIKSIPNVNVKEFPFEEETGKSLTAADALNDLPDKFKMSSPALIIFTSGSTGKPKGVVFTFSNLFYSAFNGNKLFNHHKKDRWLASLPFYHIGGFSIISRNFFYGTTLIIPQSLKTEHIVYAIDNLKPSLASLVTTQLQRLIEAGCKPNPELRHILLGGGFIEASLVSKAINSGWNISKSYGTSETSSYVTALTAEEFNNKPGSAGKVIPPNQILIVDEDKNILPDNKTGEIAVKAQSVASGYLNNEAETKKKFSGDIYYTGDYGHLDEDGFLFVEVRREDLIVSGGENIIPLEVETEILKYPGIKEVCVFGLKDNEWGHIVAAAIVSDIGITVEMLREFLSDKLPSFKHPRKIIFLDELPKTELGKIQKGKVRELFKD